MKGRILTIVSGAKSGALHIALTVAAYLEKQYASDIILRKYNKANIQVAGVIKDRIVLDYIKGLCNRLDELRPDIILVHGYSTHLWTKIAAAIKHIPVVHVEHNVEKYTIFRRWLLKKTDQYTSCYICVSQGVANHLLAQGADPAKVKVIYNGIDIEKFRVGKIPQNSFTVGMTARFSSQKDQLTLIKAIEYLVVEQQLPIRLILQGTGKNKEQCVKYVQSHQLNHAIQFETGSFVELAGKLDVFVLATHYEGLPLVVCEAMAAGIPVIASQVPGVDEIVIDQKNGFLVPEGDYKALASQIGECYEKRDSNEWKQLKDEGYNHVNQYFSITRMNEEYRETLDSLFYDLVRVQEEQG